MVDLIISPFGIKNGVYFHQLNALFTGSGRKGGHRARKNDRLIIWFNAERSLSDTEKKFLQKALERTGIFYLKSGGPITSLIRNTGDFLNEQLIAYNIKFENSDDLCGGLFLLIVNSNNDLYTAQTGEMTLTSKINDEFEYRGDPHSQRIEKFGKDKNYPLSMFHSTVKAKDLVLLCPLTAVGLLSGTEIEDFQSISTLKNKLVNQAKRDFEAIIIEFAEGDGDIRFLHEAPSGIDLQTILGDITVDTAPEYHQAKLIESEGEEADAPEISKVQYWHKIVEPFEKPEKYPSGSSLSTGQLQSQEETEKEEDVFQLEMFTNPEPLTGEDEESVDRKVVEDLYIGEQPKQAVSEPTVGFQKETPKKSANQFAQFLLKFRRSVKDVNVQYQKFKEPIDRGIRKLEKAGSKLDINNKPKEMSSTTMLMIVILVAVFVSVIGISVYLRSGLGSQQTELIAQANLLISEALGGDDPLVKMNNYQKAIILLNEAETFGVSENITDTKTFLRMELDKLQGVKRIDLQPAIFGGLDRRMDISRLSVHSSGDVYALDQGTGRVLRMIVTRPNYAVDNAFVCGPGKYGDVYVDQLVDIEAVDYANKNGSTLMGIDSRGNLLLCIPGKDPVGIKLIQSDTGWGEIKAISFNGYSLYLLDTGGVTRDIYRYQANDFAFDHNPESLFSGNIPEKLTTALDLSVNREELFLLLGDGTLTRCDLFRDVCEENVGYGMDLSGEIGARVESIAGTALNQVYVTLPPDPSVYFMDGKNASIYHFSLALNIQQQISPNESKEISTMISTQPLTAFTISTTGIILFAFGSQIYFGYLP